MHLSFSQDKVFLENLKGKEITILLHLFELGRGPRSFFSSNFVS